MIHLAPLIRDLALILAAAGITTLVFKKLKQPVVLGYIIAGVLVGPHFSQYGSRGFVAFGMNPRSVEWVVAAVDL